MFVRRLINSIQRYVLLNNWLLSLVRFAIRVEFHGSQLFALAILLLLEFHELLSLDTLEITPALHDKLTVDVMLGRIDLSVFLDVLDIDLGEALVGHFLGSADQFTHRSDFLVQLGDAKDSLSELLLVINLFVGFALLHFFGLFLSLFHLFLDGDVHLLLALLAV